MTPPAAPGPMQQAATWDAVAIGYAEEAAPHAARYVEAALGDYVPTPRDRVLDVATGPGTLALLVAPRVAHVVAVDFAPAMIEQLRARAATEGLANVEARVMDAQALELPDASFDAAFCMFGFMFFPDRARAFAELRRVLRPGGRLAIATWGPIERRPMMKLGLDAIAEALPQLPPMAKGDLQSKGECVAEMSAAGFRDVVATTSTAGLFVDSPERYLDVIERSGAPMAALRTKLGPDAWAAARKRMLAAIAARLPEGGAELDAEAIVTRGTR